MASTGPRPSQDFRRILAAVCAGNEFSLQARDAAHFGPA